MPTPGDLRQRLQASDLEVLDGNSSHALWSAVVSMATRCLRAGFDFGEYSDLLFGSEIGRRLDGGEERDRRLSTRGQFDTRLRKAWDYAADHFDYGWHPQGGLPEETASALAALLPGAEPCLRAIIEIALERGHHPVTASIDEIRDRAGMARATVQRRVAKLRAQAGPDSPILRWWFEPGFRKATWWELNLAEAGEGYRGDICVSPNGLGATCGNAETDPSPRVSLASASNESAEARFLAFVVPLKPGTEVTVASIRREIGVSAKVARRLLDKYTDEYFGGGNYPGDRKTFAPAKWWKAYPDHW